MLRRNSCLMACNFACMRSRRDFDLEFAPTSFAADKDEVQEGEGLRFAEPAPLAVFRREASKLDQPGLLRMKRQCKLL